MSSSRKDSHGKHSSTFDEKVSHRSKSDYHSDKHKQRDHSTDYYSRDEYRDKYDRNKSNRSKCDKERYDREKYERDGYGKSRCTRSSSKSSEDSSDKQGVKSKFKRKRSKEVSMEKRSQKKTKKVKDKKEKSKKKKKDHSCSSSSSTESSEDEVKLLKRLEKEREKQIVEKQKYKDLVKATETPEEKRLRRLQKKEAKERARKAKMGWDNEYLHFTNADNPYGDNNLLDTFFWKKKISKDGLGSLSRHEIDHINRRKMDENRLELEKVKKRRLEREMERAERENMMELEQREREAAQFSEFSRQEDSFQLEQARIRSQIRIQDGRAKAIDLLAQYVGSEGDMSAIDMHEPYTHLTGLTLNDLEDLLADIKVYQQLEKVDENQSYWQDLTIIVQDELRRLRQRDSSAIADATSHRQGIHLAVATDVSKIFQKKTVVELQQLQTNIENKLAGPTTGVDVGYWESLLSQLKAYQARARLRERHRENLKKKLEMLKAEQGVQEEEEEEGERIKEEMGAPNEEETATEIKQETEEISAEFNTENQVVASKDIQSPTEGEIENNEDNSDSDKEDSKAEEENEPYESDNEENEDSSLISVSIHAYQNGRFSPKLVPMSALEPGTVVCDPEEDVQRLDWSRERVVGGHRAENPLTEEERAMQREVQKNMTNEEAQFSVEARLDPQHYLWSDKYRPRKPRYFNRVHTGFEWNKYNQTHYDMDNPPPKIVQGYKFNIFFPDLINKSDTPQYELVPCKDNHDFAILKFTAGPPYEDIAFKIVSREWEYSYKRGFRCQFHNNIFQLWFHFKRYRYRR